MVETSNSWIQLNDGSPFDYETILRGDAPPGDKAKYLPVIAKALSQICRYTGHCKEFYSVAQHAVLCSYLGAPNIKYACLHHDDAEIVMSDMNTILKRVLNLRSGDAWKTIEKEMEAWFALTMGVDGWRDPGVKTADLIALQLERQWFMGPSEKLWDYFDDPTVFAANIDTRFITNGLAGHGIRHENVFYGLHEAWPPQVAEIAYLRTHENLSEPPF